MHLQIGYEKLPDSSFGVRTSGDSARGAPSPSEDNKCSLRLWTKIARFANFDRVTWSWRASSIYLYTCFQSLLLLYYLCTHIGVWGACVEWIYIAGAACMVRGKAGHTKAFQGWSKCDRSWLRYVVHLSDFCKNPCFSTVYQSWIMMYVRCTPMAMIFSYLLGQLCAESGECTSNVRMCW